MSAGDIVLCADSAGQVLSCAAEHGDLFVLVDVLMHVAAVSAHSDAWAATSEKALWRADRLEQCLAWYTHADGRTVVIRQ